jgi:PAS domain S-box-containing protein
MAIEQRTHEVELETRNEQLRREKERFRGIAENSFDIIYRIDTEGAFTYLNSAVERVLDVSPSDLRGRPFTDVIAPESVDEATAAFEANLAGEDIEGMRLHLDAPTGETAIVEVSSTPIVEDGAVVGAQGVARDITERVERERELRLKNRAVDEAQIGISIADVREPDEPLIYVNQGFERITGYAAEEAVGRNCRFLQGEHTDPDRVAAFRAAIENEDSATVELVNERADGSPFWNRVRLSPVADADGTVTHYLGFQEEITDRKRNERLFQLLNRVLRHNLRNKMNAVLGHAAALTGDEPVDRADAARIADRITDTADDLLAIAEKARALDRLARRDRDPQRLELAPLSKRSPPMPGTPTRMRPFGPRRRPGWRFARGVSSPTPSRNSSVTRRLTAATARRCGSPPSRTATG